MNFNQTSINPWVIRSTLVWFRINGKTIFIGLLWHLYHQFMLFDFDRMIIAQSSWGKCFNGKTSVCIPWALSFWPCPQEVLETLWWSWFEMCLFVNFLTFALLKQHSHHHGWISHFPGKGGVLLGQRWRWSAFVRVRQARSYPWSSKLWSLWGSSC